MPFFSKSAETTNLQNSSATYQVLKLFEKLRSKVIYNQGGGLH